MFISCDYILLNLFSLFVFGSDVGHWVCHSLVARSGYKWLGPRTASSSPPRPRGQEQATLWWWAGQSSSCPRTSSVRCQAQRSYKSSVCLQKRGQGRQIFQLRYLRYSSILLFRGYTIFLGMFCIFKSGTNSDWRVRGWVDQWVHSKGDSHLAICSKVVLVASASLPLQALQPCLYWSKDQVWDWDRCPVGEPYWNACP